MRRDAENCRIHRRMSVRRIGPEGDMTVTGTRALRRLNEQAGFPVFRRGSRSSAAPSGSPAPRRRKRWPEAAFHSLPVSSADAETPIRQHGFHVFAGRSAERDFEIVNRSRAVHREAGGKTAAHEVDQDRSEAAFDNVPAHAPDHGFVRQRAPWQWLPPLHGKSRPRGCEAGCRAGRLMPGTRGERARKIAPPSTLPASERS